MLKNKSLDSLKNFFSSLLTHTEDGGKELLHVIQQCYGCAIAEGYVAGHTPWSKIGYSPASTAAQTTLWNPGTEYVWPTGAMQMEVVSTDNTSDKAGGTGALTVHIDYLTIDGTEKEETVTMNGTTIVNTVATDIFRINAFRVYTTGSTGVAAGTISLRNLNHTTIYSQIAAGYHRARNSVYTVPKAKTLFITGFTFSAGANAAGKRVRITLHASYDHLHDTNLVAGKEFDAFREVILMDSALHADLNMPIKLDALVDLKVSVIGEAGAQCTSFLEGWLET